MPIHSSCEEINVSKIIATIQDIDMYLRTESDGSMSAAYDAYQIKTAFQPIHTVHGDIFGYEALARVYNEAGDELKTEPFFTSEYLDITDQVNLDRLARAIHVKNFARFFPTHFLFINMMPDMLLAHHRQASAEKRNEFGGLSSQVYVELLEHDCSCNHELQCVLHQMRAQGLKIAIDDYGVKASSERRARLLNPDMIKVDRSLLADYLAGETQPLNQVVALAHELGATLLLEGVENEAGREVATRLGVDYMQGFYLGRPQLLSEMLESRVY
ncbi:hypothetical protein EA58_15555 [Photobacterium galatheae]|uniref:EAL domain-containing protein n=1 Tax=Photobacterium galatheae TaxID=1654360 RepID=A0A066RK36_9GAMM|nr:hypothetical protein EA58_15555 [Photobacterium galatheae]